MFFDITARMIAVKNQRSSTLLFLLIAGLGVVGISGCDITNVDPFNKPYALETYQGPLEVDIGIKDSYPKGLPTNIVQVYTNPTGDKVIVYGLPPGTPYFEILPEKAFDRLKILSPLKEKVDDLTPTPMVSGLIARVIDANTIEVEGFAAESRLAKDLKLEVTGTIVREGKYLNVVEDAPIIISARAGNLKRMLPVSFLKRLIRLTDEKDVTEMEDNDLIQLYRFTFKGQSLTFAY